MTRSRFLLKQPYRRFEPSSCHWTETERGRWKAKVSYDSEDEAAEWLKQRPKLFAQRMTCYLCPICNKWHCGHRGE